MSVCDSVFHVCSSCRSQKRVSVPLKAQAVLRHQIWAL